MIVIVSEAQIIRCVPLAVDPGRGGIQTLGVGRTGERWKRIHEVAVRACPVQAEIEIVLRPRTPPSSSAASAPRPGCATALRRDGAEVMDEPQADVVRVALRGSHVVKVLRRSRQIGEWNELQKSLRLRRDERWVDGVQLAAVIELLAGCWIEDGRGQDRKISRALRHGGDG